MIEKFGLKVAEPLVRFIEDRALGGLGIRAETFWAGLASLYETFAPENAALIAKRDAMQARIDSWHRSQSTQGIDMPAYQAFLKEIGYLLNEPAPFQIATENVDDEVARIAGPQLV